MRFKTLLAGFMFSILIVVSMLFLVAAYQPKKIISLYDKIEIEWTDTALEKMKKFKDFEKITVKQQMTLADFIENYIQIIGYYEADEMIKNNRFTVIQEQF